MTMVCALELYSFIKVDANDLFFDPSYIFFSIYTYEDTGYFVNPST